MDIKFSQALHMLVYISETTGTATSPALAESVGTNPSHIRKISGLLKDAGIVESRQGRSGFTLGRPKTQITLAEVYTAVNRDKHLLHIHEDPNPECPIGQHISDVLQPTFDDLERRLLTALGTRTLDDLIKSLRQHARARTHEESNENRTAPEV